MSLLSKHKHGAIMPLTIRMFWHIFFQFNPLSKHSTTIHTNTMPATNKLDLIQFTHIFTEKFQPGKIPVSYKESDIRKWNYVIISRASRL